MYTYANAFLFFPILVQTFILAFDIQTYVWYRKQVASGAITPDQAAQSGTQITVALALIAAGLIVLMSLTAHCYCCILAVAKREQEEEKLTDMKKPMNVQLYNTYATPN